MSDITLIPDLTKPATTLIEKIADATGVLYEPRRIRKRAKAEAEAKITLAKADLEITDLQRRAMTRFIQEEAKKQQNIEDIIDKAIPLLEENSNPENIEADWIANFFDKCRIVSDEDMQTLWAKILAGEANMQSTFSKRTVNVFTYLEKSDAELFTEFLSFCIYFDENWRLITYDLDNVIFRNTNINVNNLIHLDSIGLVKFDEDEMNDVFYLTESYKSYETTFEYFGNLINAKPPSLNSRSFKNMIGKARLTKTGKEFIQLCNSEPKREVLVQILEHWRNEYSYEFS